MNHENLKTQVSGATLAGYLIQIPINRDWISYRHPGYPWNSASLQEERLNLSGVPAFYLASGDYCGQVEVPNYFDRVKCNVADCRIPTFDLCKFSADFGYKDTFIQQRSIGGWNVCQEVAEYLTQNFNVSGILYQSAAMHQQGQRGYCMVIVPGREQNLPDDFFKPTT